MKRLSKREVELTREEQVVVVMFNDELDDGLTIQEAAKVALADYCRENPAWMRAGLTDRFVEYVSDGTLRWRAESMTLVEVG